MALNPPQVADTTRDPTSMATKARPTNWTLRLKRHRTTLLLHVDPLQKLSSIKTELLRALQQTCPDNTLNNSPLPTSPDQILLAKPVDINDLSQGWENLDKRSASGDMFEEAKSKGKAKAKAADKLTDCPQGAGLRDGGVVAFRFASAEDWVDVKAKKEGADELELDEGDELVGGREREVWDVVVPSYEETYGMEEGGEAE